MSKRANFRVPSSENSAGRSHKGLSNAVGQMRREEGFPLSRIERGEFSFLNGNERGALSNEFQEDVLATLLLAKTPYIPREERESFRNH